jgi:TetR/AcrR family transcriptional regulator of autoinduction and epiphytic fitness
MLPADGRHRRSHRSRERILEAIARAISDPDVVLTPEHIAARAGVSISTIFRHFGDMNGLAAAMRERVAAQAMSYLAAGPFRGDLRARVRELVRRRSAVYELVGPLQRAALRRSDERKMHELMKKRLHAQMIEALGPELARAADTEALIDTLLSLGAWMHMRVERGLDAAAAGAQIERGIVALLDTATRG